MNIIQYLGIPCDNIPMIYRPGVRIELQLADSTWEPGVITAAAHTYSSPLWFIKLDNGKDAICCSEKCIRLNIKISV